MDIQLGQTLPTFERMSDFHAWNRYAAVNEEFIPMHMDDEAGKNAGNAAAFGMGNLQVAYLHALLRQWTGDDGRIVSVTCRMKAPNLRGLRTIANGRVTATHTEDGDRFIDLEVWTETEEGSVLTAGTATVSIPVG